MATAAAATAAANLARDPPRRHGAGEHDGGAVKRGVKVSGMDRRRLDSHRGERDVSYS